MIEVSRREVLVAAAGSPLLIAGRAMAGARSVDESGFVTIGGIDQWIAIQGQDDRNPAILYLHGRPAEAQSPFLKEFLPWEGDFTVVNWDQRGSGRTYGKNGPSTPDITVDRMAQDAVEIAEHVRRRLGEPKLILVGQSWGALLGLAVVKRRPDLFHAFVGTGQPVSWALSTQDLERWARKQAIAAGDTAAVKRLDEAAMLPMDDFKRVSASNKWRMAPSDLKYLDIQRDFIGPAPYPTTGEVGDWIAGGEFTGVKLWAAITSFDARKSYPEVPVPFFVIQGRDDHVTAFAVAKAYLEEVRAPIKAFIPIDGGHFACFTDPDQFVGALRKHVTPLARERS